MNELKEGIVETETKGLPMTIQKMEGVHSITIDSMVIINNADPYYGYLVTTWDVEEEHQNSFNEYRKTQELYSYKRVQKKMNVEVTGIHKTGRKYEWLTNWANAYIQATRDDSFKNDTYGGTPISKGDRDSYISATDIDVPYDAQTEEVLLDIANEELLDVDVY